MNECLTVEYIFPTQMCYKGNQICRFCQHQLHYHHLRDCTVFSWTRFRRSDCPDPAIGMLESGGALAYRPDVVSGWRCTVRGMRAD